MTKLLLAALLAAATLVAAHAATPRWKAGVYAPAHPAPEFALTGSDGRELNLARFRGRAVLMFFGFTQCPEVCPTTLATLAEARRKLDPALARDVQVVYVTVDPERDRPEVIAAYLKAFDPGFVGGTGTPAALAAMRQRYGVVANKVPTGSSYAIDHSSSVFMIDRAGRLRAMMPYGRSAADYVHDLPRLLEP